MGEDGGGGRGAVKGRRDGDNRGDTGLSSSN